MPCDAEVLELAREVRDLVGVVAAGARQHRRTAAGLLEHELHDAQVLLVRERGLSPVVPQGTRKCTPPSICRRARRRTAASSSAPSRVNGVTSAVPTPVQGCLMVGLPR